MSHLNEWLICFDDRWCSDTSKTEERSRRPNHCVGLVFWERWRSPKVEERRNWLSCLCRFVSQQVLICSFIVTFKNTRDCLGCKICALQMFKLTYLLDLNAAALIARNARIINSSSFCQQCFVHRVAEKVEWRSRHLHTAHFTSTSGGEQCDLS